MCYLFVRCNKLWDCILSIRICLRGIWIINIRAFLVRLINFLFTTGGSVKQCYTWSTSGHKVGKRSRKIAHATIVYIYMFVHVTHVTKNQTLRVILLIPCRYTNDKRQRKQRENSTISSWHALEHFQTNNSKCKFGARKMFICIFCKLHQY